MSHMKQFEHLKIQLQAIKVATNNFSDECLIGGGGFGKVYKGEIVHSEVMTVAALKRLNREFGQGDPQFWKEIMVLSQYKHKNIVSLLGYCDDSGERILVYEYASKTSLERYLNSSELTWLRRLKICIGVARGLAYLHNATGTTQQRILHRDIKSSNIILDDNWNAKIADFGLSKFGPANQKITFLYSEAVGTQGYVDPLYAETGFLTKESDVFSFGVVLFEVLCGRLCFGDKVGKNEPLIGLARQSYEQNTIKEIIFENIKDDIDANSLQEFSTIAYQCLKREREERPKMSSVVTALEAALKCQESGPSTFSSSTANYLPPPLSIQGSPLIRQIEFSISQLDTPIKSWRRKDGRRKFAKVEDFYLLNRSTPDPRTMREQNLKVGWIHRAISKLQLCTKGKETRPSTLSGSPLCRQFKFSEIQLATQYFNQSLVIGKGGFGKVYKGNVVSGSTPMVVAIKRWKPSSEQGPSEFRAELKLLPTLRHNNIVPLIGYCNYGEELILVYEYITNGTLYEHLHKLGTPLSWIQRLKICLGAARGLHYLHSCKGIDVGVIHLDVKSSNIMLHESWAPIITDFGLAMIGPTNVEPLTYVESPLRGTLGYLDPAYILSGMFTVKSDVYSFGVVLLEVLCRKSPIDNDRGFGSRPMQLASWFQYCIKNGNLKDLPDSDIIHQIAPKCLKQFAGIVGRCFQDNPERRPNMAEVLFSLESILIKQEKYNDSPQVDEQLLNGIHIISRDESVGSDHASNSDIQNKNIKLSKKVNKTVKVNVDKQLLNEIHIISRDESVSDHASNSDIQNKNKELARKIDDEPLLNEIHIISKDESVRISDHASNSDIQNKNKELAKKVDEQLLNEIYIIPRDESVGSDQVSNSDIQNKNKELARKVSKPVKITEKKGDRNLEASCWDHIDPLVYSEDGVFEEKCIYCKQASHADTSKNGMSTLINCHLKKCTKNPNNNVPIIQSNNFLKNTSGDGEGSSGGGTFQKWVYDVDRIWRAVLNLFVLAELPFALIRHPALKELIEALSPDYKLPSRLSASKEVSKYFVGEKIKLHKFISKTTQGIHLTTDTWTSADQKTNYMVLTAHFIDDDWVLHNKIINFKPIHSQKGEDIGREIFECISEWELKNVMTMTVNNGTSNENAIKYLTDRFPNLYDNGKHFHIRCMAYILNSIVKDVINKYVDSVDVVRSAIIYIKKSTQRITKFKECIVDANCVSKRFLCVDCPTRWNSTFDMLKTALELKDAFIRYERHNPSFVTDLVNVPSRSDWLVIQNLVIFFEKFKQKTESVTGTSYPVAHRFFMEVLDIEYHLRKCENKPEFVVMFGKMRDKFDKYWGDLKKLNLFMYFAIILDPCMKMQSITYGFRILLSYDLRSEITEHELEELLERMVDNVENALTLLFDTYKKRFDTLGETSSASSNHSLNQVLSTQAQGENSIVDAFIYGTFSGSNEIESELKRYLNEQRQQLYPGFDVLVWWKLNGPRYPVLAKMAKDILAIQVSSVTSESAFSMGGRVLDHYRTRLSPSILEALICTQDWVRKSKMVINMDGEGVDLEKDEDIAEEIEEELRNISRNSS